LNQVHSPSAGSAGINLRQANTTARAETEKAVKWFDAEKELWVMIVTGAKNSRAFSAGADLKEWLELYIAVHFLLGVLTRS
jgi:enoyl-CoA hydratase/carnithine racemase